MLPRSVEPSPEQDELLGGPGVLGVTRIWPRGPQRLSLELTGADGFLLAGQLVADADDLARITRGTRSRAVRPELVLHCASTDAQGRAAGTVLVQGQGADRRLPALPQVLAEPGTSLMVHRPERRAVVRRPGDYVRIFRPGRTGPVVSAAQRGEQLLAGLPGYAAPAILAHRPEEGVVVTSALAGASLRELVGPEVPVPASLPPAVRAGAAGIGRLLGHLGQTQGEGSLPVRDAEAELAWVQVWLGRLSAHLPEVHEQVAPVLGVVAEHLRATPPGAPGVVHGDLHDGQVLIDQDGALGVLDWDTVAVGEDALDAGNVWAHTELRHLLGQWSPAHAAAVWTAVLDAWDPDPARLERAAAYRRLLLLRLACQYAFRPAHAAVVGELVLRAAGEGTRAG